MFRSIYILASVFFIPLIFLNAQPLRLNNQGYFEKAGLNVFVFNNWDKDSLSSFNRSGIEIIHHGVRTASRGDVRLDNTPEPWDAIPELVKRKVNEASNSIEVYLRYPDVDFDYMIKAEAKEDEICLSVHLEKPLPKSLRGKAGLNLEFLPTAYFEKTFLADGQPGIFPRYPSGPTQVKVDGRTSPLPIAGGRKFVFAPEDRERRLSIEALTGSLSLFDGRNKAQNGWYVVRTFIPSNKTGKVIEWSIKANTIPNWLRPPMIAHSQVGYHPNQQKVALIELDKNDSPLPTARLMKLGENGSINEVLRGAAKLWGLYTRYNYLTFDFSPVKERGLYFIEYGAQRTKPFPIDPFVYENAWQLTHDILTNRSYQSGEHIDGWYDVIINLVQVWEHFHIDRDETTIDQKNNYIGIHHPDGKPDLIQQIEYGALALIAPYRVLGQAIPSIMNDSLDNRLAFTYGSIAALAAASRALKGYNDELAEECLATAEKVWEDEHSHKPVVFYDGNTMGDQLEEEELKATVELFITTQHNKYRQRLLEQWSTVEKRFAQNAAFAARAMPLMDEAYAKKMEGLVRKYRQQIDQFSVDNPFGVPISSSGFVDNRQIINLAQTNYILHKAFPNIITRESVFKGLNYIFGCHPGANISFVSGVGTVSKKATYGTQKADHSLIPGGIAPGVLMLKPDFPEDEELWPLLSGERADAIRAGSSYLFLVHSVRDLLKGDRFRR